MFSKCKIKEGDKFFDEHDGFFEENNNVKDGLSFL
jgi:hypothetical protein